MKEEVSTSMSKNNLVIFKPWSSLYFIFTCHYKMMILAWHWYLGCQWQCDRYVNQYTDIVYSWITCVSREFPPSLSKPIVRRVSGGRETEWSYQVNFVDRESDNSTIAQISCHLHQSDIRDTWHLSYSSDTSHWKLNSIHHKRFAMAAPAPTTMRQPRPSIVIDPSGCDVDYPGSDVLIHKKDFLIHIKKLSVRSQSSDCAAECRNMSCHMNFLFIYLNVSFWSYKLRICHRNNFKSSN